MNYPVASYGVSPRKSKSDFPVICGELNPLWIKIHAIDDGVGASIKYILTLLTQGSQWFVKRITRAGY
jgi:hypothetical protein